MLDIAQARVIFCTFLANFSAHGRLKTRQVCSLWGVAAVRDRERPVSHRGLVIIVIITIIIRVLMIVIAIILIIIAMIIIRRVGCLACYQRDRHTLGRHQTDKPST